MEDRKWGAEERDLLYQVMCCYSWLPAHILTLLFIVLPRFSQWTLSLHAAKPTQGCESMTASPT